MVLGSAKGRLGVGAILVVGIGVELVQEGDQPVSRVEGGLRRLFDPPAGLVVAQDRHGWAAAAGRRAGKV